MKVKILSKNFTEARGYGIDRYAFNVVNGLKKRGVETEVVYNKGRAGVLSNVFFEQFALPLKMLGAKAEVFHAVSPFEAIALVYARRHPSVVTFHDLIPMRFPSDARLASRLYFGFVARLAKRVDEMISVSHSTKRDLVELLGVDGEKIHVTHEGVDSKKFFPKPRARKKNTIVFTGGLTPRKNVSGLIRAFRELGKSFEGARLVIGGRGKEEARLKKLAGELGLRKKVSFAGFVPEEKLCDFYNSGELFVYPSFYEGFGFPVLEAMACGVPVVASNVASLPEIVGNAGLLVDAGDAQALAEAMQKILENKRLAKKLGEEGLRRAKEFSWQKTVDKTILVYERLRVKEK